MSTLPSRHLNQEIKKGSVIFLVSFVCTLIVLWAMETVIKPVDAYLFIRADHTREYFYWHFVFNCVMFMLIFYILHLILLKPGNERLFNTLIWILLLLILSGSPLVVRGDDLNDYCWNHQIKSTKTQCEEHHCFYDPYLERCFFSLEHARKEYPCNNWSGNLTMNGYSNEEACTYHWCSSAVSKVDNSFTCIDPPSGDMDVYSYPIVSWDKKAVVYDPFPERLYWLLGVNFPLDLLAWNKLSVDDDIIMQPNDPSRIMIDYKKQWLLVTLDDAMPHKHTEPFSEIHPFINNFSYPVEQFHNPNSIVKEYCVVFPYIVRTTSNKEQVETSILKQVLGHGNRTAPIYSFESRIAKFYFSIKKEEEEKKEEEIITSKWKMSFDEFKDWFDHIVLFAIIIMVICLILVCASRYNGGRFIQQQQEKEQQEQVLHDSVDDDDNEEKEGETVPFGIRKRTENGELLELYSDDDDVDDSGDAMLKLE